MSVPVLEATDLRIDRGGGTILDVSRLALHDGEIMAVLGPNGAGKSTLLRALALLDWPTTGLIRFRGRVLERHDALAYRRRTAMLFQEPLLLDTTVFENAATGLRLRGVRGGELRRRLQPWLERAGIAHLARRSARTLSGGEARRVSLVRALAIEPELLFLDEPFTALDAPTRASFVREFAALLAEQRPATVLVTHDQAEARALADTLVVLLDGQIAQAGPVEEGIDCPADPRVAAFFRSVHLPERPLLRQVPR